MREFEIREAMEDGEKFDMQEIQEQREQLRLRMATAQEAGNIEKTNYFQGKIAKLDEQLEIREAMENGEKFDIQKIQEQREQLRLRMATAQEAGNIVKTNYFQGEIAKLDEQLSQLTEGSDGIILGEGHACGHSESYWKKAAAKELAEHGKTTWYYSCIDYLEKAIENGAK